MALAVDSRRVGNVTVVTCRGRLVAGSESAALQQHLDALFPFIAQIVLHLSEVEYLDSGGLGLLVRCVTRARNAGGELKLCAISPKIDDVLKVTRLKPMFAIYDSEADAIADAHRVVSGPDVSFLGANVLCVDQSQDILAFLREILKEAGYRTITASNLPDALILLRATHPGAIVIGAELLAAKGTRTAEEFTRLAKSSAIVPLPSGISEQDAAITSEQVLRAVRDAMKPTTMRRPPDPDFPTGGRP